MTARRGRGNVLGFPIYFYSDEEEVIGSDALLKRNPKNLAHVCHAAHASYISFKPYRELNCELN